MNRTPILLDLTQATGVNTVPLDIKLASGKVLHFEVPERTDVGRARMVSELERLKTDDQTREVACDWLLACASADVTRADVQEAVQQTSALSQILTVLMSGRLPDPKVMDRLLATLLDKLTVDLIKGISRGNTPRSPRSSQGRASRKS